MHLNGVTNALLRETLNFILRFSVKFRVKFSNCCIVTRLWFFGVTVLGVTVSGTRLIYDKQ